MQERHKQIVWKHEHGRPGKDVVKNRGSFTMEEVLQFVETSSVYILRGCLLPDLERAWLHLRRAVMHYCRLTEGSLEMERRVNAKNDALAYAALVEEHIGPHMCTMVLHLLACHAVDQETATGSTARSLEWWVEQMCGLMKETTEVGLIRHPEKVIGNDILLRKALVDRAREVSEYASLVGLSEATEAADFKGPTDMLRDGAQLLHVGEEVHQLHLCEAELAALKSFAERLKFPTDTAGWLIHDFCAAQVKGEVFQAHKHYSTAACHSFHAQIGIPQGQSRQRNEHFATIQRFLCVAHGPTEMQFRVAQVDIYKKATKEKYIWVVDVGKPLKKGDFISVGSLVTKFMFARDERNERRNFVLPCYSRGL